MKSTHRVTLMFVVFVAAVLVFAAGISAADNDPVTVTDILAKADVPLTDAQKQTIADIDPEQGFMAMMSVNQMFTEGQTDALIKVLGEMSFPGGMGGPGGGMGGGMEMPRMVNNLFQVIILEKEKLPLTEKQVKALGAIEMGPDMRDQMNEIYTAEQTEAMQKYMSAGPGGGMGGFGGGGMGGGMR